MSLMEEDKQTFSCSFYPKSLIQEWIVQAHKEGAFNREASKQQYHL